MAEFILIHNLVAENGKTYKENNMELVHKFPVGALVEYSNDDASDELLGVRLYVVLQTRDCDGSLLYTIGPKGTVITNELFSGFRCINGISEENLTLVEHKGE